MPPKITPITVTTLGLGGNTSINNIDLQLITMG